jgi:predicted RNase H-like HicB family nuclease
LIVGDISFMRKVIIYPGEDGYWVAECPSLPPCISQGKTKAEAIANIKEAIQLYVELLEEEDYKEGRIKYLEDITEE